MLNCYGSNNICFVYLCCGFHYVRSDWPKKIVYPFLNECGLDRCQDGKGAMMPFQNYQQWSNVKNIAYYRRMGVEKHFAVLKILWIQGCHW